MLRELWEEGALCDVALRTYDGGEYMCHKIVLAASSGFFRALFSGAGLQFRDGGGGVVDLGGVDSASLSLLLAAVYGRGVEITAANVESLLSTANQLEVLPVHAACASFLLRNLAVENSLGCLSLAVAYGCDDLKKEALAIAGSKFAEVMAADGGRAFNALPLEAVLALLGSDALQVESEQDAFAAGVAWVAAEPTSRVGFVAAVVRSVRLWLLPPAILGQVAAQPLVASCPEASALVGEVARRQRLGPSAPSAFGTQHAQHAGGGRVSNKSLSRVYASSGGGASSSGIEQWEDAWDDDALDAMMRPRVGVATCLVAAAGYGEGWRSLKSVEIYDPLRGTWEGAPPMNTPFSFVGAASMGGQLYVVGGSTHNGHMERFDPKSRAWDLLVAPSTARVHAGVATARGRLFLVGGRTGSNVETSCVESYDPDLAEWQEGTSMHTARSSLGIGELSGWLYAVGGQAGRTTFATCERMDPMTGQWHPIGARMSTERKYLACCGLGGRLWAVGGMNEQRERMAAVESLDPREGRWAPVAPMALARSSAGVAVLNGRMYVAGGNAGDDAIHGSAEAFDLVAGRWVPAADLACGRSGLALAAI